MTTKQKFSLRTLLSWHRYAGLGVAILAIHLAITGILLNHTSELGMNQHYIGNKTILKWYGIKLPVKLPGYQVEDNWLTYWDNTIYFNDRRIARSHRPLIGATQTSHFYALATTEEIWLLTVDGEVIEKLSSPGEKLGDILSIGQLDQHIVIKTTQGIFKADKDLVAWQPTTDQDIKWSVQQNIPHMLMESLFHQGHSISWERLMLDLHSGRIATKAGTLLVDLAGIVMLFLAITGFTIWLKRRNRKQA
jgi:hypothetical protein